MLKGSYSRLTQEAVVGLTVVWLSRVLSFTLYNPKCPVGKKNRKVGFILLA